MAIYGASALLSTASRVHLHTIRETLDKCSYSSMLLLCRVWVGHLRISQSIGVISFGVARLADPVFSVANSSEGDGNAYRRCDRENPAENCVSFPAGRWHSRLVVRARVNLNYKTERSLQRRRVIILLLSIMYTCTYAYSLVV